MINQEMLGTLCSDTSIRVTGNLRVTGNVPLKGRLPSKFRFDYTRSLEVILDGSLIYHSLAAIKSNRCYKSMKLINILTYPLGNLA